MNTADMVIFVHPEFDQDLRTNLEKRLEGCVGVDCAEFEHKPHPHALLVKYDPEAIKGIQILEMVRTVDPEASGVGL